ncbi:MAG TPA: protein-methionine-sulfoxide reductase catalytic subunit MsrP, partial [Alphaproteobacteria bacterium]|nr:protein-methionine-sulfoxide reductase catalytic subunit MsrP [Alphaproteobacteria bacterium]
ELPEAAAAPEAVFLGRRALMKAAGAGAILAATSPAGAPALAQFRNQDPSARLYPVARNARYKVERAVTPEDLVTTYNNFYEFGSHKEIWRAAEKLPVRPWTVVFDGMVEEERTVDIDTLLQAMPLEERVYRHRCVEAWSIVVPWSGFPMAALLGYARPLASAKYVRMETFGPDEYAAPGFRQFWYPWPYVEGLTIEEATNELAFLVTGAYGKPLPAQNGAPLRLSVPWKYGFKSVKSIVRFTFTDERPVSFWEELGPDEYGFWANVNPEVPHPRWSQATERVIGTRDTVPTQLYNGYGEFVAELYRNRPGEALFM